MIEIYASEVSSAVRAVPAIEHFAPDAEPDEMLIEIEMECGGSTITLRMPEQDAETLYNALGHHFSMEA